MSGRLDLGWNLWRTNLKYVSVRMLPAICLHRVSNSAAPMVFQCQDQPELRVRRGAPRPVPEIAPVIPLLSLSALLCRMTCIRVRRLLLQCFHAPQCLI